MERADVARASALVRQMTLEEKAAQIQHDAPAIPRLHIPAYNWWNEGLHGVARAGEATVFPQAVGLAATFDVDLIHRVADVTATEFRAKYLANRLPDGGSLQYRGLTVWSPNVNIFRDPRWGRGQETYGEDPYLTSRMAVAFITGLQGDDPQRMKTMAAVKHLAVHSGPERDRHIENVHPSPRDLVDTYLPAFHAAVTEARSGGIMCAYNAIDDVPACGNPTYTKTLLRDSWGFKGYLVSDCMAVADFYVKTAHAYVATPEEAVAKAVQAGTDLICDEPDRYVTAHPETTVAAVRKGFLAERDLSRAVERLLVARMKLGLFDPPGTGRYAAIGKTDFDTPAHRALAVEAARRSLVLLKNDGLLPLKGTPRRIAVIGPNADSIDSLVGNYNGTPSAPITVLAGIRERFPQSHVTYVAGSGWVSPPLEDVPDAAMCIDAACAQRGLKADEFGNGKLDGRPTATRIDPNARIAWSSATPEPRDTSIRWNGYMVPTESGVHTLRYTGGGPYRIYLDDKLVTDVWDVAWPTSDINVDLVAARPYRIRIEAAQKGRRSEQCLQWSRPSAGDAPALAAAKDADLVVFVGGLTWRLEGESMRVGAPGFDGGDRTSLDLPQAQEQVLKRLQALGKPVVMVLMSGGAVALNWADAHVPAIIQAWYPGGEGGRAVAELLAGDFSPSGRLPVTFYTSVGQLPPFKDYAMRGRTYRYFTGTPLYPFGHGLSYTRFAYTRAVVDHPIIAAGGTAIASVSVRNAGTRAGAEIVQLYVSRPGIAGAPQRALSGFRRVYLKPGETQRVSFPLDAKAMSVVDEAGRRIVEPGQVALFLGGGQPGRDVGGAALSMTVRGRRAIPAF